MAFVILPDEFVTPSLIQGVTDLLHLFYGQGKVLRKMGNILQLGAPEPAYLLQILEDHYTLSKSELLCVCNLKMNKNAELECFAQPYEKGEERKISERHFRQCLYGAMCRATGMVFPWGTLTGIRPGFVVHEAMDAGMEGEKLVNYLDEEFSVLPERGKILVETVKNERTVIKSAEKDELLLYIHIPFCKSRCAYCSFTPKEHINPDDTKLELYTSLLIKEMKAVLPPLVDKIRRVYFGGGTPAILSADEIRRLLETLKSIVPASRIKEMTFEAGRADSLDFRKIDALKRGGVRRICLNPQSLNSDVLEKAGRPGTKEEYFSIFRDLRSAGFEDINMDMIAGLEGETPDSFLKGLSELIGLKPENLTVHALSKKNNAELDIKERLGKADKELADVLLEAHQLLKNSGYSPYYMYRQKNGIGGLGNISYSLPGHFCGYNVLSMSDTLPVIALGAGSISKARGERGLKRIPSAKILSEYEKRLDLLIEMKRRAFSQNLQP